MIKQQKMLYHRDFHEPPDDEVRWRYDQDGFDMNGSLKEPKVINQNLEDSIIQGIHEFNKTMLKRDYISIYGQSYAAGILYNSIRRNLSSEAKKLLKVYHIQLLMDGSKLSTFSFSDSLSMRNRCNLGIPKNYTFQCKGARDATDLQIQQIVNSITEWTPKSQIT